MSNGNRTAFPIDMVHSNGSFNDAFGGLTKRELIAAMAMQGMMTREDAGATEGWQKSRPSGIAKYSLKCADALLAELAKEPA